MAPRQLPRWPLPAGRLPERTLPRRMVHLPPLRRSQEDVVRVEPGQQQPPPAVQEAAVEQVHGEEPPEGADEKVHRADVPALTDPFLRGERRGPARALDELLQAPVRVMEQRGREPR